MSTLDSGVTLTNPHLALRLEPRHGGRIVSLTTLAGDLTVEASADDLARSRVPDRFGLLSLQLWQDSYWHNDLCHLEWPITNTEVLPNRIATTLSGRSLLWPGVEVSRRVVVTADPWIDVEHRLDPGSTTGPYLPPAFWFSNVMHGRGRTFVPGSAGVLDYPRWSQDQSWCHEPTDGWIAWIGDTGGLAFVTDPAHLRHVRLCHHRTDRVEWVRRRVPSIETTNVRLVPFSGLDHVDGVGAAGIVAVEKTPGGLVADVYALATGAGTLTLDLVESNGTATPAATATASLMAGTVSRFTVPLPAWPTSAVGGWWRFSVTTALAGATATSFSVPAEGPSNYLRGTRPAVPQVPELPRADSSHQQPPRSFRFDASPAPLPPPWVTRKVSRLRVLALVKPWNTATLLALARQFDFELTLPFVPRTATLPTTSGGIAGQRFFYELGDRFTTVYGDELVAGWTAALSSSQVYDAIMLDIDGWGLLPQALQAEILARVQAGTGLLVIGRGGPGGPNPETAVLDGLLPMTIVSWSDYNGPCHPADDRTVRGLPWTILPSPGFVINYAVRPGATVLVEFAPDPGHPWIRFPLLARTSYGAGRVLDLVWGPYVVPPDGRRQRPANAEGMETLRYDLALIARLIQDVSGRDPAIAIRNVALAGNTATVDLEQVDATASIFDLDWVARDRFSVVLGSGRQSSSIFPASGALTFSIPSGTWTVDVVIHPSSGEPGWGAGGRTLDFPVTVNPDVALLGREHAIQISPAGPAAATQYVVNMLDGRARVLVEAIIGAGATATLDAGRIETPHAELRVHALDAASALIAQAARTFRVRIRTGVERWPIHFWNDSLVLPGPLFVRYFDANAALGISGYFRLSSVAGSDIVSAADRLAIPYVPQSSGYLYPYGGEAPDGSGSPLTLTDGEAIATGAAADTHLAATSADANVLYYVLADDEPTPPPMDVSHDARTLTRFRAWLSDVYGHADSLLQREWDATFTLSAATPRSYAQAVAAFGAGDLTYAPWADHRRFMMDVFSRAPAIAREALRRGDPEALTGTSGENVMGLSAGRDWWVRGRALDMVGRYATSTAIVLKALGTRSFPWTGYDDPDPIIRRRSGHRQSPFGRLDHRHDGGDHV